MNIVKEANTNYLATDSYEFTVNNGTFHSTPATVEITVNPGNSFPLLTPIPDQMLNEGTTLVITNTASDSDLPTNTLTFSLVWPPAGMSIDPGSGVLTWTPAETQGPSTNVISVKVTDNGTPALSDSKKFTVTIVAALPAILSVGVSRESVNMTWSAIKGKVYRVQYKPDLTQPVWNPLPGDVTATTNNANKVD